MEEKAMRVRMSGFVVVAVIGLLAGCGGGSSSSSTTDTAAFKSGFQAATSDFQQGAKVIATDVTQANHFTNAQLATIFSGLAAKWHTATVKLDSLHPPANSTANFNALKSNAAKVESDLNAIASAAKSGDATAARQATRSLIQDVLATKSSAQKVDSEVGISG
jgi:hypothetical protein